MDVGPGKEEANSKLRGHLLYRRLHTVADEFLEVLAHHIASSLCQHVLIACCHDAGYVPVLRQYAAQEVFSTRVTLMASGKVRADIQDLGLRSTKRFESLFNSSDGDQDSRSYANVSAAPPLTIMPTSSTSSDAVSPPSPLSTSVENCDRLRPILRDNTGKRVDKPLSVHEDMVNQIRKLKLCSWHYLRADCVLRDTTCKRNHKHKRPLSTKHYDAQWYIARSGACFTVRKGRRCEDDQCFYGHNIE